MVQANGSIKFSSYQDLKNSLMKDTFKTLTVRILTLRIIPKKII